MENDLELNINEKQNEKSSDIFKLEHSNQKLKNNIHFIKWRNDMLKKYGNDAKLFKCIDCNNYFYVSNDKCKTIPLYLSECPSCHLSICYFCSCPTYNKYDHGRCCIKRRIYCMLFQDGFTFISLKEDDWEEDYKSIFKLFLFPLLNFIGLVAMFSTSFYYKLQISHKLFIKHKRHGTKIPGIYEGHLDLLMFVIIINSAFAIALSFSYIILDIYIKIILLLISSIFKNYPIKYYLGIINEGLEGV